MNPRNPRLTLSRVYCPVMVHLKACFGISLLVVAVSCSSSKDAGAAKFVQDFYDWYVPIALAQKDGPASNAVLKRNPPVLAPELLKELEQDSEAQAKSQEIVGLDFDPFLNSQDPCERYVVGDVKEASGKFLVNVHSVCSGKKSEEPAVVAETSQENGSWLFVNFRPGKGEGDDLHTILKQLERDRGK